MKKYCTILMIFTLFSCDSFFHEEDNPYLRVDKQQEKIDLINGIYTCLVRVHDGDYLTVLSRSDDVNNYTSYQFNDSYGSCTSLGSEASYFYPSIIGNIYVNLYTAIININNLLPVLSEQDDRSLIGELYFLRAYCYFKLARLFGTPPLIEDIVVNYYVEKPSYQDVYGFIEQDMLKAIKFLPETYADSRIPGETPHQGTAKALLAEVYLAMAGYPVLDKSKYAEAARLSGEVIQQADFYHFALLNDFAALWTKENKHNTENIFGLFFSSGSKYYFNNMGQVNIYAYQPKGYYISDQINFISYKSNYKPELKFFDDFPNNYRKYNSFLTGKYTYQSYTFQDSVVWNLAFIPFHPLVNACDYAGSAVCLKWIGDYLKFSDKYTESNYGVVKPETTLYLLRYAQTLLTYAEAKARSGHLDQSAYDAVNKIRRRANHLDLDSPSPYDLPPNLTTEQFLDAVVWERAWELSFEPDGRWFDIIRLDLRDKLSENRYPKDQPTVIPDLYLTDDWYFYQIPQEDRWANPNFE